MKRSATSGLDSRNFGVMMNASVPRFATTRCFGGCECSTVLVDIVATPVGYAVGVVLDPQLHFTLDRFLRALCAAQTSACNNHKLAVHRHGGHGDEDL